MYLKSKTKKNKRSNKRNLSKSRKFRKSIRRKSIRRKSYKKKSLKTRSRFGGAPYQMTTFFANRTKEKARIAEEARLAEEIRKKDEATQKEKDRQSRIMDALASECTICLEPMDKDNNKNHVEKCLSCLKSKDIPTQLPCDHFFHGRCIQKWKRERNDCPLCRRTITQNEPAEPVYFNFENLNYYYNYRDFY